MYWLYFFLLVIAIGTPIFIEGQSNYLSEDMTESALIFIVGTLGLFLYIIKEKSLLRHVKEKLLFQQKNTTITKDLSQSYSYIGEVNRKVDILKGMMQKLVEITNAKSDKQETILWEILDTIKQLTQSERVSLRTFRKGICVKRLEEKNDKKFFSGISNERLLRNTKKFFEFENIQGVYRNAHETKIFLLLSRKNNDEIDADILSILMDFLALLQKYVPVEKE